MLRVSVKFSEMVTNGAHRIRMTDCFMDLIREVTNATGLKALLLIITPVHIISLLYMLFFSFRLRSSCTRLHHQLKQLQLSVPKITRRLHCAACVCVFGSNYFC